MSVGLFNDTVRFLSGLEPVQLELHRLYTRRLSALTVVDPKVLHELVEEELVIQRRLRRQFQQRTKILANARRENLAGIDLRKLQRELSQFVQPHGDIDPVQYDQAVAWMKRVEARSWDLRQISWVNWHVVRRGCREFQAIRSLIANCGKQPTEYDGCSPSGPNGGALIDAAV